MKISELKKSFRDVLNNQTGTSLLEIRRVFEETMRELEIERGWDEGDTRQKWTDDELRVILSDAPTKENCLKHARAFKRGYGSIELIYRWAASTRTEVKTKRADDAFIKQIQQVAKRLDWRT